MNHECGGCSYIKGLSISNLLLLGLIILYYTQSYFHVWKDKNMSCLVELRLHQQYCLPCWLRHCCYIVIYYVSVPTSLEVQDTKTFRELWIDICFCIRSMCDIIAVAQIDSLTYIYSRHFNAENGSSKTFYNCCINQYLNLYA